jgi:hypothetical protein
MAFVLGVISDIAANVVFWLLLGSVFWGVSTAVIRRFSRFFGLVRIDRIGVYLSNLWTPQSSVSGRTEGYTIDLHEFRAAQSVERLFGSAPLRLPDLVRGLVDALWLNQQVRCATDVSPIDADDADLERNMIIVGSSARNSVRAHYVKVGLPTATITGETDSWAAMNKAHSITILQGGTKSEVSLPGVNFAVVERCRDPDRGTIIFFCLGLRADSSWAATEYLVKNWKRLVAEFGDSNFKVFLGFPKTERFLEEYKEPLRLSMEAS